MSDKAKYIIWFIVGAMAMFVILKIASKAGKADTSSETTERLKELARTQEVYNLIMTKEFRDLVLTKPFRNFVKSLAEDHVSVMAQTLAG